MLTLTPLSYESGRAGAVPATTADAAQVVVSISRFLISFLVCACRAEARAVQRRRAFSRFWITMPRGRTPGPPREGAFMAFRGAYLLYRHWLLPPPSFPPMPPCRMLGFRA